MRSAQAGLGLNEVILYELDAHGAQLLVRAAASSQGAPGRQEQAPVSMQLAIGKLERGTVFQGAQWHMASELVPQAWMADAASALVCPVRSAEGNRLVIAALSREQGAFSADEAGFAEAVSSLLSTALQRHESDTNFPG